MSDVVPGQPPFSLRARLLTPLADGSVRWLDDALVRVDARGRIVAVDALDALAAAGAGDATAASGAAGTGEAAAAAAELEAAARAAVDVRPLVVMPGLVDAHVHIPQVPAAGLGAGMDLLAWLERYVFPLERAFDVPAAERLAPQVYRAMAAAGTTTFAGYSAIWADSTDACFRAAEAHGIRAVIGMVLMDRVTYDDRTPPGDILGNAMRDAAELCERWHGADDGRLRYAFTPRFAVSCTHEMLRESASLARHYGATWQTHLSEDRFEIEAVARHFPDAADYLDVYDQAGGLGGNALFAHAIHLSEREVDRLEESGSAVAHCPVSNMFIASGVMPLGAYLEAGVRVGLGTDVAGAPELSILTQMREGFYQQHSRLTYADGSPAVPGPLDWLRLGTLGGARALGLDDAIGSVEPGKDADLILVDPDLGRPPGAEDCRDVDEIASRLIFRERPGMVRAAWVRGRRLAASEPGDHAGRP